MRAPPTLANDATTHPTANSMDHSRQYSVSAPRSYGDYASNIMINKSLLLPNVLAQETMGS